MPPYNRSPLRWLGGKFNRLADIAKHMPADTKRTLEPFAGSAVFSLNLGRGKAVVNDANKDLIGLYSQIRYHRRALVAELNKLFVPNNNTKEAFNDLRNEFNSTTNSLRKAAIFVYLNQHSYGGMTQYACDGRYTTPFGNLKKIAWPEASLALFAEKCNGYVFTAGDFIKVIDMAGKRDFVYADPPYADRSEGASFRAYTKNGFRDNLQQVLVERAIEACDRGATVLISNHYTRETELLYSKASEFEVFDVRARGLGCKRGEKAMSVKECLAIYKPKRIR